MEVLVIDDLRCWKCKRPVTPDSPTLCVSCQRDFRATSAEILSAVGAYPSALFNPPARYDERPGDDLLDRWKGFMWAGFGMLIPVERARAMVERAQPLIIYPGFPEALQVWEAHLFRPRRKLRLQATYYPGGARVGIVGLENKGVKHEEYKELWAHRRLFSTTDLTLTAAGRRKGSRSMDPADWRVAMAFIKACRDDGCTWPQVEGRLGLKQIDDPDFPSIPVRDPETLARWLDEYEAELLRN
jgi:hypothetical protein